MSRPSILSDVFFLLAVIWAAFVDGIAGLLLAVAVTKDGRMLGVAALVAGTVPALFVGAWRRRSRRRMRLAYGLAVIGLSLLAFALLRAFTDQPRAGFGGHVFAGGGGSWPGRHAANSLVPEVDQLMVAFTVAQLVDPLFGARQATQLKDCTRTIYRELEQDPEFQGLDSTMADAYRDFLGLSFVSGQAFIYVPDRADRSDPAPVLIFFHGSGGNFKAYLWVLREVAERCKIVVVAPSFGMGNWHMPETQRVLETALAETARIVPVDFARVHVMGLSNGGLAVTQLAGAEGSRFCSFVLLSPVFDVAGVRSPEFARNCRARSFLVLSGSEDDRVPIAYVLGFANEMGQSGARVTFQAYSGANHFLFFTHRQQIVPRLVEWFNALDGRR